MSLAFSGQKFQDWFTQQWAIVWGRRIEPDDVPWLMGPFGDLGTIADDFFVKLAEKEGLTIQRNITSQGLIPSIEKLNLSDTDLAGLSQKVINFYEKTGAYNLNFSVNWNPFFRIFGMLVNILFSHRIDQLNIPTNHTKDANTIHSEIITLTDTRTKEVKYTIWFRTDKTSGRVIYSGVYSTCTLPSGETCVKAVFPLPKGNATVIMSPKVENNGGLTLDSSGKRFGDAGFYFLVNDSKGRFWSQYVGSFRDRLNIYPSEERILAEQTLTLWHCRVLTFKYLIELKK
ncbi:hypothetical protein [Zobellia uliginosa]|uniref:hypothetical protein n=1 Tax=Zobellia uliginosa TaxID=143224 RepID=UPI001C077D3E|nr:hypothetical protein [Zobellia uliginosa]MBU2946667.1 hypothetical protein [Zobellia uliginosa]